MLALQADGDANEITRFVEARRVGWAHEPRQLVWRCVAHLLSLIVRSIEETTSRASHGALDEKVSKASCASPSSSHPSHPTLPHFSSLPRPVLTPR